MKWTGMIVLVVFRTRQRTAKIERKTMGKTSTRVQCAAPGPPKKTP